MAKSSRPSNGDVLLNPVAARKQPTIGDGRRNNRPPEAGKIKPGEVRNPNGRGGKAKVATRSQYDEVYLAEAARIVSRDGDGVVNALKRLIQEDWHDALRNGDEKARVRVLAEAKAILAADTARRQETYEWLVDAQERMKDEFTYAEATGRRPPDAMHPDHVIIEHDGLRFVGPAERRARQAWELLKSVIQIAAVLHEQARQKVKWDPSPKNCEYLAAIEQHRRKYMRKVPKGWNWRERIYTRWPDQKITDDIIKFLKEQFDADCKARDRLLARRKRQALTA